MVGCATWLVFAVAAIVATTAAKGEERHQKEQQSSSNHVKKEVTMTTCPSVELNRHWWRYHSDDVCNRNEYNEFKRSLHRGSRITEIQNEGRYMTGLPNQETIVCPTTAETTNSKTKGLDTIWAVENTATTSVVLSFVTSQGTEVSAFNWISPPEDDPRAILRPGEWRTLRTYEGHKFIAREFSESSQLVGRILLVHTVGLIPVGQHLSGTVDCPEEDAFDPSLKRTPPPENRHCNTVDVGFRNMAGCPLNGYWVTPGDATAGISICSEHYRFHLGTHGVVTDFDHGWTSPMKWEGTFYGHTYNFRLAHDTSVFVEQISLKPTRIVDCPAEKESRDVASEDSREEGKERKRGRGGHASREILEVLVGNANNATNDTFAASQNYICVHECEMDRLYPFTTHLFK